MHGGEEGRAIQKTLGQATQKHSSTSPPSLLINITDVDHPFNIIMGVSMIMIIPHKISILFSEAAALLFAVCKLLIKLPVILSLLCLCPSIQMLLKSLEKLECMYQWLYKVWVPSVLTHTPHMSYLQGFQVYPQGFQVQELSGGPCLPILCTLPLQSPERGNDVWEKVQAHHGKKQRTFFHLTHFSLLRQLLFCRGRRINQQPAVFCVGIVGLILLLLIPSPPK